MTKAKVKKAVVKELKRKKRVAKENGDVDAAAKIEQGLEALARRRCARDCELFGIPACRRTFAPMLTLSSRVTEHYCSPECALLVIAHRENWVPIRVVAAMQAPAPAVSGVREERAAPRPRALRAVQGSAGNDEAEAKYGPKRAIVRVVDARRASSHRVELECGHVVTVPKTSKIGRCKACR